MKRRAYLCVLLSVLLFCISLPVSATENTENKMAENFSNEQDKIEIESSDLDNVYTLDHGGTTKFYEYNIKNGRIDDSDYKETFVDGFKMIIDQNYVQLDFQGFQDSLKLSLSKFLNFKDNTFLGISNTADKNFKIINFRIEKNSSTATLTQENISFKGKPVLYVGIFDEERFKVYYGQFLLDHFDFDSFYPIVQSEDYGLEDEELSKIEESYVTLKIPDVTIDETLTLDTSNPSSENNVVDGKIEDLNASLDRVASLSKDRMVNASQRAIIAGVPDSIFKTNDYFKWKHVFYGWAQESGYALYTTNFAGTGNKLSYIITYTNQKYREHGYGDKSHNVFAKVERNCAVIYIVSDNRLAIFSENPSITMTVTHWARVYSQYGVINQSLEAAVIRKSRVKKIAEVLVGHIKYVGAVKELIDVLRENPTDSWNIWKSTYKLQQEYTGKLIKWQKYSLALKSPEDRAYMAIKTHDAPDFDIGSVLQFRT